MAFVINAMFMAQMIAQSNDFTLFQNQTASQLQQLQMLAGIGQNEDADPSSAFDGGSIA